MAAISGTEGAVQFINSSSTTGLNAVGDLTQWQLNIDAGLIDTNAFGSTWRQAIPGLRGGSGSFQGFWSVDQSTAGQFHIQSAILNGTLSHIDLVVHTTSTNVHGYEGDAYLGRLQIGAQVDNAIGFSGDFTFNGEVSYSTDLG